jgi:hypothetical protein
MTITELINMCLTHNISPDAEIYVNGNPAVKWFYYYRDTKFPDETPLCYKINIIDNNYDSLKELKPYVGN